MGTYMPLMLKAGWRITRNQKRYDRPDTFNSYLGVTCEIVAIHRDSVNLREVAGENAVVDGAFLCPRHLLTTEWFDMD